MCLCERELEIRRDTCGWGAARDGREGLGWGRDVVIMNFRGLTNVVRNHAVNGLDNLCSSVSWGVGWPRQREGGDSKIGRKTLPAHSTTNPCSSRHASSDITLTSVTSLPCASRTLVSSLICQSMVL